MKLYSEKMGNGPALVMLHGWGANSGVWAGVRDKLAEHFSLTMIDLPGHGRSEFDTTVMQDISALADELVGHVDEAATWLGWSLGGMAALAIAQRHPDKVNALVTVASSPRLLQADDWTDAVDISVLAAFNTQLQGDPLSTLTRFIALQTRGCETQREDIRMLKKTLLGEDIAQADALAAGLKLLEVTDLRAGLASMHCPALVIAGERDTLHPLASMQSYADALPRGELHLVERAGHAPFISHKEEFVKTVLEFIRQRTDSLSQSA